MSLLQAKNVLSIIPRAMSTAILTGRHNIVMVRHGKSETCRYSPFCGWYDSPLSEDGHEEALRVASVLKTFKRDKFDLAYSSVMRRSLETLGVVLKNLGLRWIPVRSDWRLNGRHYGDLTAMPIHKAKKKYDPHLVDLWQHGVNLYPPHIRPNHPCYYSILNNPIFSSGPKMYDFPKGESLKKVASRATPFWKEVMVPEIKKVGSVLVVAHESSLKGLVKHLDGLSDSSLKDISIPPGIPFMYALDERLRPLPKGSMQFMELKRKRTQHRPTVMFL